MRIITDAAANLTPEKAKELGVEVVPFQITFMGKTYRDGVDITPADLYRLYGEHPHEFSSTSQPSVGDFKTVYDQCGDEPILSIHLSSGLSGAYSSAVHAARMISEEQVTVVDSKMVGPALGWMVEVAAYGARLGWSKERIIQAIQKVKENTLTMVSFSDIKYLVHSGRVSHLRGIMASVLKIKPIIGMNPDDGRYDTVSQEVTVTRAVRKMVDVVSKKYNQQKLRLQLMHGDNLPGVEQLRTAAHEILDCIEEKLVPVTLTLGAHTGPSVIGLAVIPLSILDQLKQS
jgi:DegV family protein with EDD domain